MVKPLEGHWKVVKSVVIYLKGTTKFGIKYIDDFYVYLEGYYDLD